jgi:hypothetical protein
MCTLIHSLKFVNLDENVQLLLFCIKCEYYSYCACSVPDVGIVPLKREMCPPKKDQ